MGGRGIPILQTSVRIPVSVSGGTFNRLLVNYIFLLYFSNLELGTARNIVGLGMAKGTTAPVATNGFSSTARGGVLVYTFFYSTQTECIGLAGLLG